MNQDTTAVSDTTQATSQVQMQDLPQEILVRLDALASKLGVGVEHIWEILVRQAYAEAISAFCLLASLVTVGVVALKSRNKISKWINDSPGTDRKFTENLRGLGLGIVSTIYIIFLIVTIIWSFHIIPTALVNPEYFAFDKIINVLG